MNDLGVKIEEEIKRIHDDLNQKIDLYYQIQREVKNNESVYNSNVENISYDEKEMKSLYATLEKLQEQKEKLNSENFIKKMMKSHKDRMKSIDNEIKYHNDKIEAIKSLIKKTIQKNSEHEEKQKQLENMNINELMALQEKLENSKFAEDMAINNLLQSGNRSEMLRTLIEENPSVLRFANTRDDISVFKSYLSEIIKNSNDKQVKELLEQCLNEINSPKLPENGKYKIPSDLLLQILIQNELCNSNNAFLTSSLNELIDLYLQNDCKFDEKEGKEVEQLINNKLNETLNITMLDNDIIKFICNNKQFVEGHITLDMLNEDTMEEIKNGNSSIIDEINMPINEDELALVRTCNDIPNSNNELVSVSHRNYFSSLNHSFFREDGEGFEKPIDSLYRSTIHFTVNGLVSNHMGGNFSGNNFFYIDDFKPHKGEDLLSLAVEDTFFKDGIRLSDNAVICMSKTKLLDMRNNHEAEEFLRTHKVFIYDLGDDFKDFNNQADIESAIAKYCLICLGKPCYQVSDHGYQFTAGYNNNNPNAAGDMLDFIRDYAEENGYGRVRHSGSKYDIEDNKINYRIAKESMKNHYIYVVENSNVEQSKKDQMLKYLDYLPGYFSIPNEEFLKEERLHKYIPDEILDMDDYIQDYSFRNGEAPKDVSEEKIKEINAIIEEREKDYISREEFTNASKEFIDLIGIDEYNRLTREYNEHYRESVIRKHAEEEKNGIARDHTESYYR